MLPGASFPLRKMCIRDRVQCVLHTTDAVKDHEQAEHDGQDTHHDVAAQDQERTQCQTDDAGDQDVYKRQGMDVVDKIAAVRTDWNDKPTTPVKMKTV